MAVTAKRRKCAICGRPVVEAFRPFCSAACADKDLGHWLTGRYAIAGSTDSDEDGDTPAQPSQTGSDSPDGQGD